MLIGFTTQARTFRRRIILPYVHDRPGRNTGLLPITEALLFRRWALATPVTIERDIDDGGLDNSRNAHPMYSEEGVLYPFADELFWKEGDEGEWDGDGVPMWKDL